MFRSIAETQKVKRRSVGNFIRNSFNAKSIKKSVGICFYDNCN